MNQISSLEEFIKQISDKQDATYSQPPQTSVRVIPPVGDTTDEISLNKNIKPKTLKFIKSQNQEIKETPSNLPETNIVEDTVEVLSEENPDLEVEELFIKSGTDIRFKEEWMDLYFHAVKKPKDNYVSKAFCKGRFRINNDGNKEILPEYSTYDKSANDILKDKWL